MPHELLESPSGALLITSDGEGVTDISWAKGLPMGFQESPDKHTNKAAQELREYFKKSRQNFDFSIHLKHGTPFQRRVWQAVSEIPYGHVVSYKELAIKLDSGPRAIGNAVGANPLPIVIPCHRVIGSQGQMGGFSGGKGIPTKKQLLQLEGIL
jgi:methylated-DNA-[protein]-cysteine S-methyltransferase